MHGPVVDTASRAGKTIAIELNAAAENPLVDVAGARRLLPAGALSWRHQPGRTAGTVASEDVDFSDPN